MFTKISFIAAILFSTSVFAELPNSFGNPTGLIPMDRSNINKVSKSSVMSVVTNADVLCTSDEFVALPDQEVLNYLLDNSKGCLGFLFNNEGAADRFSVSEYVTVANAARDAAVSYDGTQDISNYFLYLRSAQFIAFFSPQLVSIAQEMEDAAIEAINAIVATPNFVSRVGVIQNNLQFEWTFTVDSYSLWINHHNTLKDLMQYALNADAVETHQVAITSAISTLFRGQNNDAANYGANVVALDADLPDLFERIATNPTITSNSGIEYLANNAALELGRLLKWPEQLTTTSISVQKVLDANDRLNVRWLSMVTAIFNHGIDCTSFTGGNVCKNDELIAEVLAVAFPNDFIFDNGSMRFHTTLSYDKVEQLAYQLKETQSAFFKVTGATTPVDGDPNDVAIFRIYETRNAYEQFQGFLYGLDTNNGGIYIERDATLFTYDREAWESIFSLEELSRHEYGHYLTSRYMVPGMWCFGTCDSDGGPLDDGRLYEDQRLTWFEEGFANFIAGATQSNGVNPLKSMIGWIAGRETHYTPAESVSVIYGDPYMYPYAQLMFNYLYANKTSAFKDLTNVLRADDKAAYDIVRDRFANIDPVDFNNFIVAQIADIDSLVNPWKDYPAEAQLPLTDSIDVQSQIENEFGGLFTSLSCNDLTDIQFGCDATFEYNIIDAELPLYEIHEQIDGVVAGLLASSNENLRTTNCHVSSTSASVQTLRCEGGLRRSSTLFNDSPEADDQTISLLVNSSINGQLTGSDPEGDTLTFEVVIQPSAGVLTLNSNGLYTYESDGDAVTITFEFVTNDGEFNSTSNGVVTINVLPNTAPTASNVAYTTEEGQSVNGSMNGSDPEGSELTYIFVGDPSNGDIIFDSITGEFTYTPTEGFIGVEVMHYFVSDGELDSEEATITVTVNGGTVEPINNAPTTSNGSLSVVENNTVSGTMNGSDPDGDVIIFTALDPSNGTLSWNGDGSFTYTPNTDFVGTDSFTFTINDGELTSNTSTITITITDDTSNNGSTGGTSTPPQPAESGGGGSMGVGFALVLLSLYRRRIAH